MPPGFRTRSGDDATALAYIAASGDGCISTISNVTPDVCRAIFSSLRQGRMASARHLERRLLTLETCLARQNPAALKYALSLLGLMDPAPRLPLVELDEPAKAEVARALSSTAEDDLAATAQA